MQDETLCNTYYLENSVDDVGLQPLFDPSFDVPLDLDSVVEVQRLHAGPDLRWDCTSWVIRVSWCWLLLTCMIGDLAPHVWRRSPSNNSGGLSVPTIATIYVGLAAGRPWWWRWLGLDQSQRVLKFPKIFYFRNIEKQIFNLTVLVMRILATFMSLWIGWSCWCGWRTVPHKSAAIPSWSRRSWTCRWCLVSGILGADFQQVDNVFMI